MSRVPLSTLAVFLACAAGDCVAGTTLTNKLARIELNDQFDALHRVTFPATNVTVLTIADHAGSQQVDAWVQAIKQRYSHRLAIYGIADVSRVPPLLRGKVRRAFKKSQPHPVLLDWSGETVGVIGFQPDQANIVLLDPQGRIVARYAGPIRPTSWQAASTMLDALLAAPPAPPAATHSFSPAATGHVANHPP